jgi:hypothetical protein
MVLMFLWDAPLDVPGAPRDAEPREAAASAAPRLSVVEFAPVDGAAQLALLGEAAARLLEAGALGEAAVRLLGELAEPDELAEVRARVRPPELVQPGELAFVRGGARIHEPVRVREAHLHALVASRCCDLGQVLASDAAYSGATADSHVPRSRLRDYAQVRHYAQELDSRNSPPAESQQSADGHGWRRRAIPGSIARSVHAAAARR